LWEENGRQIQGGAWGISGPKVGWEEMGRQFEMRRKESFLFEI
jgi:hypothetical protein